MITLGLNATFHDSAAALVIDGVPVAAAAARRSVCRHRKAGICSTSTASATRAH